MLGLPFVFHKEKVSLSSLVFLIFFFAENCPPTIVFLKWAGGGGFSAGEGVFTANTPHFFSLIWL